MVYKKRSFYLLEITIFFRYIEIMEIFTDKLFKAIEKELANIDPNAQREYLDSLLLKVEGLKLKAEDFLISQNANPLRNPFVVEEETDRAKEQLVRVNNIIQQIKDMYL